MLMFFLRLKSYFLFNRKKIVSFGVLLVLLVAIPVGIYELGQIQDLRKRASYDQTSMAEDQKETYVHGEIIIKFRDNTKPISTRKEFADGLNLDKKEISFSDIDQDSLPERLKSFNSLYKIKSIEKVFKDTKTPREELEYIRNKLPVNSADESREIKENEFLKIDLTKIYKISYEDRAIPFEKIAEVLYPSPEIEYVQPNYLVEVNWKPNDYYYNTSNSWGQGYEDLWPLKGDKLDMEKAWNFTKGKDKSGTSIIVAVVDTGIDFKHEDITRNIWINTKDTYGNGIDDDGNGYIDDTYGWDFYERDNDPKDVLGHGTHVSGIIAAEGNNEIGIIGVAPESQIMVLKPFSDQGLASIDTIVNALVYAGKNGALVVNNSWGCRGRCNSNPLIEDVVRAVNALGITLVFAAGNSSDDVAFYSPQNMLSPKTFVVGASDGNDNPTFFSNYGAYLDVLAPGGGVKSSPPDYEPFRNILSLKPESCSSVVCPSGLVVGDKYLRQAGTSMAAPYVSGAAALLKANNLKLTPEQIRQILRSRADDVLEKGVDTRSGAGRLNVGKALSKTSVPLRVEIISPHSKQTVDLRVSSFNIRGTVKGKNFLKYQIYYNEGFTFKEWVPIGPEKNTQVENGLLGSIKPSELIPQRYLLRINATDTLGDSYDAITAFYVGFPALQITNGGYFHYNPQVAGENVVYSRFDWNTVDDKIYLYNLRSKTEKQLSQTYNLDGVLDIDESFVVFEGLDLSTREKNIYLKNLTTDEEYKVVNNIKPYGLKISDKLIIWRGFDGKSLNIFACYFDQDSKSCPVIQITDNTNNKDQISVSNNQIVWSEFSNNNWDVYLCTYDNGIKACPIIKVTDKPFDQNYADIDGEQIVWQDNSDGKWRVYLYDIASKLERRIIDDDTIQKYPIISDGKVMYTDNRYDPTEYYDFFVYDITKKEAVLVMFSDFKKEFYPDFKNNRFVWADDRNNPINDDVFVVDLSKNNPQIITNKLPKGEVDKEYSAVVEGHDKDINDKLTLNIKNLPKGLSKSACESEKNKSKNRVEIKCSVSGIPKKSGSFKTRVVLTDNNGGKEEKTLQLKIN